ncbi:uncharacterized protein LOC18430617 isoform X2 [Amborella trichopoda]|uniref:uncharacterized protein LOC18430617 isoform X2 n=1 Tax=Amborella trichopoda TaxID=13333 RepID=UPI0005D44DFB|nr:uncharacterized protein LOC18430617 isoform X2 [Amborella trichopoda]|eukprot:XP_011622047.1 uncharacterized protein LOC18430617 isoform X2 [Amborella trichopoda]
MAKVAVHDFSSSSTIAHCASKLQFESTTKRKTPLELRGEQLKRKQFGDPVEGSSSPLFGGDCEIRHGQKKAESTKTPRYIDTRVDDVFPVKKFNDLLRIHSEKQKKTFAHLNQENALSARGIILKSPFEACHLAVKKEGPLPWQALQVHTVGRNALRAHFVVLLSFLVEVKHQEIHLTLIWFEAIVVEKLERALIVTKRHRVFASYCLYTSSMMLWC